MSGADDMGRPPLDPLGMATAVDAAVADGLGEESEDQAELFGRPVERRGRGRPAGSRNRSTKEWGDWLLSRFQSPLVTLAALYTGDPRELARDWSCDVLEVVKLQAAAAGKVAEYVHQKQPQAVTVSGGGDAAIVMMVAPDIAEMILRHDDGMRAGGAIMPPLDLIEGHYQDVENKGISETADEKSTDEKSTDAPQGIGNAGENGNAPTD